MTPIATPSGRAPMTARLERLRLQFMAGELAAQIAARIKSRRLDLRLNQRQLADRIPKNTVSNQTISDWERAVYQPSSENLELLATALEVDLAYFYMREQENPEETPNLMDVLGPGQPSIIEELLREVLSRLAALEPLVDRVAELEKDLELLRGQLGASDVEATARHEEVLRAIRQPPEEQQR